MTDDWDAYLAAGAARMAELNRLIAEAPPERSPGRPRGTVQHRGPYLTRKRGRGAETESERADREASRDRYKARMARCREAKKEKAESAATKERARQHAADYAMAKYYERKSAVAEARDRAAKAAQERVRAKSRGKVAPPPAQPG